MNAATSCGAGLLGLMAMILFAPAFEYAQARGGGPTPGPAALARDRAAAHSDKGGGLYDPGSSAYDGQELAGKAKVTIQQARAIALKARPGRIADLELERERGGSGLRYSFDVRNGAVTHEVGVDARTGRVLENRVEGSNLD